MHSVQQGMLSQCSASYAVGYAAHCVVYTSEKESQALHRLLLYQPIALPVMPAPLHADEHNRVGCTMQKSPNSLCMQMIAGRESCTDSYHVI